MDRLLRLHWGCGDIRPAGWINSDIEEGPGIDISADILKGLPLDDNSVDYISSQHALNDLRIYDQVQALGELYRVLKPGGVLRLALPDLDLAIAAYQGGRHDFFLVWDWNTLSGNFITQILWYNHTHTLFTYEFAEELLRKAGFQDVRRVVYHQTISPYPEIVELDSRKGESFYVEAFK
jgi:ubiquinone/menaquinone biosynthesis C-methylase UbiE